MSLVNPDIPLDQLLATFERLVRYHDLTYGYSDDPNSYRRGSREMSEIRLLAAALPKTEVTRIWNENVDRVVAEDFRAQFYWRN